MTSLMTKLCRKLGRALEHRRRIIRNETGSPYLSRYYLTGMPVMPDGSGPFDQLGNPKPEARMAEKHSIGIYLHCFHRGDSDDDLHNHPWVLARSFILAGGYSEERRMLDDSVERREIRPFTFNSLTKDDFHRVDLGPEGEAWTIFVTGPRHDTWGFWDRFTKKFIPWRERINERVMKHANGAST